MGSELKVQSIESILGEYNQSSEMTTWGKLDDVKSVNVASVNTWKISSSSLDFSAIISVDKEWSLSQDVLGVSVLSSSASEGFVGSDLGKIISKTNSVQSSEERFGVWGLDVVEDKWEFWDVLNLVTSGHDKRSNSRCGKS